MGSSYWHLGIEFASFASMYGGIDGQKGKTKESALKNSSAAANALILRSGSLYEH